MFRANQFGSEIVYHDFVIDSEDLAHATVLKSVFLKNSSTLVACD